MRPLPTSLLLSDALCPSHSGWLNNSIHTPSLCPSEAFIYCSPLLRAPSLSPDDWTLAPRDNATWQNYLHKHIGLGQSTQVLGTNWTTVLSNSKVSSSKRLSTITLFVVPHPTYILSLLPLLFAFWPLITSNYFIFLFVFCLLSFPLRKTGLPESILFNYVSTST